MKMIFGQTARANQEFIRAKQERIREVNHFLDAVIVAVMKEAAEKMAGISGNTVYLKDGIPGFRAPCAPWIGHFEKSGSFYADPSDIFPEWDLGDARHFSATFPIPCHATNFIFGHGSDKLPDACLDILADAEMIPSDETDFASAAARPEALAFLAGIGRGWLHGSIDPEIAAGIGNAGAFRKGVDYGRSASRIFERHNIYADVFPSLQVGFALGDDESPLPQEFFARIITGNPEDWAPADYDLVESLAFPGAANVTPDMLAKIFMASREEKEDRPRVFEMVP